MAHSKSALKRLRQNVRHRERNLSIRSATRTAVKQARSAIDAGGAGDVSAVEAIRSAASALDKAAKRHVIHRNAVARHKSRLARRLNRAGTAVAEEAPKRVRKAPAKSTAKKAAAKPRKTTKRSDV